MARSSTLRSLRLRQMHCHRVILCSPNCQLVKVSRRVTLPLVYRRWLITSAGIRLQPILTSGGSLRFQSLKTLPHPRCPVKGPAEDRQVSRPETQKARAVGFPPQRSTGAYFSGTQRVSHIDITLSSAGAVALPRGVAAGSLAPHNNSGRLAPAAYYVKYVIGGNTGSAPGS
jgi:hypothetical protein